MEGFRIVNLILQSVYLLAHLLFVVYLHRKRQPTPIWYWFVFFSIAAWLWVSGRLMESVVYLFFPGHNDAYVFAANFQYIGNTTATVAYTIWTLFLAGYDRLASNRLFQAGLFTCPAVICALVFTNPYHHLFYTWLVMGQQVRHCHLFAPCVIWTYLILLFGYLVSIIFITGNGQETVRRVLIFSLFPTLPALAVLVRSLTGVDKLDYTPMIMAVSLYCLYLIAFRLNYVKIIPLSLEAVMDQTTHPIGIYDPAQKTYLYSNRAATERYGAAAKEFPELSSALNGFEGVFAGRNLKVDVAPLRDGEVLLVTATDVTEIAEQQALLDTQIGKLNALRRNLEEENRNIDAYLDSLYQAEGLRQKQELIETTRAMTQRVFTAIEANLTAARESPATAEAPLEENIRLTQTCIADIRAAVARLREG